MGLYKGPKDPPVFEHHYSTIYSQYTITIYNIYIQYTILHYIVIYLSRRHLLLVALLVAEANGYHRIWSMYNTTLVAFFTSPMELMNTTLLEHSRYPIGAFYKPTLIAFLQLPLEHFFTSPIELFLHLPY